MRYKVVRSFKSVDTGGERPRRRKKRLPTEPSWDEGNLWVEHDTIPDAEVSSGVVTGEIRLEFLLP